MRHLNDITDLSAGELEQLLRLGEDMIAAPHRYAEAARGKILATLFFEPSTRTRLSFESAMLSLGGGTLGFSEPTSSSAVKGESLGDTIATVSCYAHIIAMRHPREGATVAGAMRAGVPLINAGDGGHCHPSQTLTDLLTIRREKGEIKNLNVGLCGDLKYGRTVHSLVNALARYQGIRLWFISPEELQIPHYMKAGVLAGGALPWQETQSLEQAIPQLDLLYMTRIQKERFADQAQYQRLKDSFILTPRLMTLAKSDMTVMHPLPRVNEISVEVDGDPRAAYFRQVENGRYVRMALIHTLLSGALPDEPPIPAEQRPQITCQNPSCITGAGQEIPHLFTTQGGGLRCYYCEAEVE